MEGRMHKRHVSLKLHALFIGSDQEEHMGWGVPTLHAPFLPRAAGYRERLTAAHSGHAHTKNAMRCLLG